MNNIKKRGIEVEHFLTESMWSYILNKPNQGKDLSLFRVELMNVPEEYGDVV